MQPKSAVALCRFYVKKGKQSSLVIILPYSHKNDKSFDEKIEIEFSMNTLEGHEFSEDSRRALKND